MPKHLEEVGVSQSEIAKAIEEQRKYMAECKRIFNQVYLANVELKGRVAREFAFKPGVIGLLLVSPFEHPIVKDINGRKTALTSIVITSAAIYANVDSPDHHRLLCKSGLTLADFTYYLEFNNPDQIQTAIDLSIEQAFRKLGSN